FCICIFVFFFFFFFFQAEDGIRDLYVTGVQTCALPICPVCNEVVDRAGLVKGYEVSKDQYVRVTDDELKALEGEASKTIDIEERSEERRVGKECRSRWAAEQ